MIVTQEEIKYDSKAAPVSAIAFQNRADWRLFTPRIDAKKALDPYTGAAACPDGAIDVKDGKMKINYDACTGCLLCLRETPFRAISDEKVEK